MITTIPIAGCDIWGYLIVVEPAQFNEHETRKHLEGQLLSWRAQL